MPATAYLLPVGSVISGANVSTRGNNYTVDDGGLQQLLRDAGLDTVADLFPSVGKLRYDGTPVTSVAVTCVIGVSTPTPLSLHYDIPYFSPGHAAPSPVVIMGDGDGTVNRSHDHTLLQHPASLPIHLPTEQAPMCVHNGLELRSSTSTKLSTCTSLPPARICCSKPLGQFE